MHSTSGKHAELTENAKFLAPYMSQSVPYERNFESGGKHTIFGISQLLIPRKLFG